MWLVVLIASVLLIGLMLLDAFETTVLPRRVTHRYRFARLFFRTTWTGWRCVALRIPAGKWREAALSLFGPISVLAILVVWVLGLILGFAMLHWAADVWQDVSDGKSTFWTYLNWSGITFFTLGFGYGDVTPVTSFGRVLVVVEAGLGFGFLAVMIGYLPGIQQVFSRREVAIGMLDARAGSPPTAGQLLIRLGQAKNLATVDSFLAEWEAWSAELLESHLSFPLLSFYRSQHNNQSWLAAISLMLDTCALLMVEVKGHNPYRAQLTFAMARHTVVDLALIFGLRPQSPETDRLSDERRHALRQALRDAGLELHETAVCDQRLTEIRGMYEPFLESLSRSLLLPVPPIYSDSVSADNWQRSAWMQRAPGLGSLPVTSDGSEHF
jgi:hypothetical protein